MHNCNSDDKAAVGAKDKIKYENVEEIKIIDGEGYDIEQFLCRCSNKTSPIKLNG